MRSRAGFTLLEICVACAIGLMLILLMVPSMAGLLAERRLTETFERFDDLGRKAQLLSVSEQRAFVVVREKESFLLAPSAPKPGEVGKDWGRFDLAKDEVLSFERPAALERKPPMVWTFWKSGTCEPIVARFKGPAGTWVVAYDALTTRGTFLEQAVR